MDHAELEARLARIRLQLPPRDPRSATYAKVETEDLIEAILLDHHRVPDRDLWALNCLSDAIRALALGYYRRAAHLIAYTATPHAMRGRLVGRRADELEPLSTDGLMEDLEHLRGLPVRLRSHEQNPSEIPSERPRRLAS